MFLQRKYGFTVVLAVTSDLSLLSSHKAFDRQVSFAGMFSQRQSCVYLLKKTCGIVHIADVSLII